MRGCSVTQARQAVVELSYRKQQARWLTAAASDKAHKHGKYMWVDCFPIDVLTIAAAAQPHDSHAVNLAFAFSHAQMSTRYLLHLQVYLL